MDPNGKRLEFNGRRERQATCVSPEEKKPQLAAMESPRAGKVLIDMRFCPSDFTGESLLSDANVGCDELVPFLNASALNASASALNPASKRGVMR